MILYDESEDAAELSRIRSDITVLQEHVVLPCGILVPNRLVKAPMYESLADFYGGLPNQKHLRLYETWGKGGWGMVLTGNVQVDAQHLTLGRDMIIPQELTPGSVAAFKRLASAIHDSGHSISPLAIMQLSHAGRQSPRIVGGRSYFEPPHAPSAVPLRPKEGTLSSIFYRLFFAEPKAMTDEEVDVVKEAFVRGAMLAQEAGFDGAQIHCSHGYLISQFLSPRTNKRGLPYGPPNYLGLLYGILAQVRKNVPSKFALGVKLNAADYVDGKIREEEALDQLKLIAGWGMVDFIEISGGDYERPDFSGDPSPRQAFFSKFSRLAVDALPNNPSSPKIMLTGSLRTRSLMAKTIRSGHAHLLGIGRPAVIYPALPSLLFKPPPQDLLEDNDTRLCVLEGAPPDSSLSSFIRVPIRLVGAGINTAWYCALMWRIGKGNWKGLGDDWRDVLAENKRRDPDGRIRVPGVPRIGAIRSLWEMWVMN